MGGLAIGYLGDNVLGRKRVLLLSFAGAGLSYLLVGLADSIGLLHLLWLYLALALTLTLVPTLTLTLTLAPTLTIASNITSESRSRSSSSIYQIPITEHVTYRRVLRPRSPQWRGSSCDPSRSRRSTARSRAARGHKGVVERGGTGKCDVTASP